ncbi:MAG: hypothetical protein QOD33_959 [Pyrinomonadaceae bacterium]|nr:hypothetical protein [Pyrinomonadaceae bacterium]
MSLSFDKQTLAEQEDLAASLRPAAAALTTATPAHSTDPSARQTSSSATANGPAASSFQSTPNLQSAFGNAAIAQSLSQQSSANEPGSHVGGPASFENARQQFGYGNGAVARANLSVGTGLQSHPATPGNPVASAASSASPQPSLTGLPAINNAGALAPDVRSVPQVPQTAVGPPTPGTGSQLPSATDVGPVASPNSEGPVSPETPPGPAGAQTSAPATVGPSAEQTTSDRSAKEPSERAASSVAETGAPPSGPENSVKGDGPGLNSEQAVETAGASGDNAGTSLTALDVPETPEVDTQPAIDTELVANAAPNLQTAIAQVRSTIAQKKTQIRTAAAAAKDALHTQAATKRQEVSNAASELVQRARTDVAQSRSQVSSIIGEQRAVVSRTLAVQKETTHQGVARESQRLGTEAAKLSVSVMTVARDRTSAAAALGVAQSTRARTEVARQSAEARRRGANKAHSIHDEDPERAQTQQFAVLQVAEEQAQQITTTGPEIEQFALDRAGEIATSFSAQAIQVATGINSAVPEVQASVLSLSNHADGHMDLLAQTTLGSLAGLEQRLMRQLDELEAASLLQARGLAREILPQIDAAEQAGVAQLASLTQSALAALDDSAGDTIAELTAADTPGEAQVGTLQEEITQQTLTHFQTLTHYLDTQILEIAAHANDGFTQIQAQLNGALTATQEAARSGVNSLVQQLNQGFELARNEVVGKATGIVDQSLAKFGEPVNKAIAEFQSTYAKGERDVIAGVTDSLLSNDRALDEMGTHCKLTEAADRAREEYDRPTWQKVLIAVGKAVLYLAAALLFTFVVAVVIFVGAIILGITGVTFAIAFAIAVVLVAIGFVIYEFVQRLIAYKAEHGAIDSFWEALGVSAALLLISVASLTGIPQIIEGLRGKRFFSDIPLTSQERYDLVIGGVLQLVLIVVARSFRGRGGRTGRAGPVEEPLPVRPPIEEEPPVVLVDPWAVLARRFGLSAEVIEILRTSGIDVTVFERILARGVSGETVALITSLHGRAGVGVLDRMSADGFTDGDILRLVDDADRLGQLDALSDLTARGIAQRLLRNGFDSTELILLLQELHQAGIQTIDGLMRAGVQKAPAIEAARLARQIGAVEEVTQLATSGNLENPLGLRNFLREVAAELEVGNQGKLTQLREAAQRSSGGPVAIERSARGQADIIDFGRQEALQMKVVSSPEPAQVGVRVNEAASQLRGERGEVPPAGFKTIADIRITNPDNPMFPLNRAQLLLQLRNNGVTQASLAGVGEVHVTNGSGTHVYTPNEF